MVGTTTSLRSNKLPSEWYTGEMVDKEFSAKNEIICYGDGTMAEHHFLCAALQYCSAKDGVRLRNKTPTVRNPATEGPGLIL